MVQINWTIQARNDLKCIAEYISKDSKEYARLQALRIRQRTKILNSQVLAGKTVSEIENFAGRDLQLGVFGRL